MAPVSVSEPVYAPSPDIAKPRRSETQAAPSARGDGRVGALDAIHIASALGIVTYGMHELARAVRDIRDLLKNRGDLSNHHVMSFDGDAHNEQERERWEQVVKEREREQQEQDIPEESSD